jgi:energy-coupling factor transporter transmembrane protein EcfT
LFHPTSILLAVSATMIATQFLHAPALAVLGLALLAGGEKSLVAWWKMVRRMRWLFACVWLVVAYGIPGDALFSIDWLPTYEGIAEANLQVARLAVMLGGLAWMITRLGTRGLVAGLLGLFRSQAGRGGIAERFPVRLALAMTHLEQEMPRGAWRAMLDGRPPGAPADAALRIEIPALRISDVALPVLAIGALYLLSRLG